MNNKKENILKDNIYNFTRALNELNCSYLIDNIVRKYRYSCIVEREATRLLTHFEDWTTSKDDLHYKDMINKRIFNNIEFICDDLKGHIKKEQGIEEVFYNTYKLLHSAGIL